MEGINKILEEKAATMTNQEFFMFVAQVSRAISMSQENAKQHDESISNLSTEIKRRLEADQIPNELDVIAQFISVLQRIRMYNHANDLAFVYQQKVNDALNKPFRELEPRFEQLSFVKLTQIFLSLSHSSAATNSVLRRVNSKIRDRNEPKPIMSVMRMLDKIIRNEDSMLRHGRTLDQVASHFDNNSSISINQLEIATRARLLGIYATHAANGGNQQARLVQQLLNSIKEDLPSL